MTKEHDTVVLVKEVPDKQLSAKKKPRKRPGKQPACIEYHGVPGATQPCLDAVIRLIQFGNQITKVQILSADGDPVTEHCLLLTVNDDLVAIKSGFASGYRGTGSIGFSYVLALLEAHGAEIEEYSVPEELINRCDFSLLTQSDLQSIAAGRPIRPSRWPEYVFAEHWQYPLKSEQLWREFPAIVPFAIVDDRITDLAMSFWGNPNDKLLVGYKRLEDIIRERTGIDEHGTKLFSQAFSGPESPLIWKDVHASEHLGRTQLFIGTFMAYRNPRAHRELQDYRSNVLTEFLLLNHLYCLEKEAVERASEGDIT